MNKLNESWDDEIKKGLEYGWYSDGTSLYAKTKDDMLNVIDFMESEELLTKRGAELITNKINQLSISEDKNIRISFPEGQMKDLIIYIADANGKNEEMVDAIEDFYDIEDEAMAENKKLNEDKDEDEEKEETLDGKDVTNTFKNYKAFEANFGPIKIVKNSYDKNYKVYRVNEEDADNYIYYSNDKDNIEGWLYGAVQAANGKFNKLKNKNEAVNKSILNEETSNSYTAISYYDDKLRGVEDETSSSDWSVITDFAHDKLMGGSYVKITNTTTGKEKVISPDTYQDEFDGEFVVGIGELDESVGDKSQEETLPEAIDRASEEESSAIDTYDGILEKIEDDEELEEIEDDDGLKEMIEEIKTDEENHKELLDHYAETGEALTDEELEELDSEDDESDKDSEDLEVVEEAPNVELNTTSTILNGIKDEINNRCKGLVTAETVTIDDAVGLKLTRKTDKLDLISIFDNIVEVMNQHKIQKGDYEIELRGDNLILAMKNMTVNENKKLEESHMDDYSADKKYKVTYINGEGKEKETEYKPSKNTNIAGVQKELGEKNKDFFKLKEIKESKKVTEDLADDNAAILEKLVNLLDDIEATPENLDDNLEVVENFLAENHLGVGAIIPTIYIVKRYNEDGSTSNVGRLLFYRSNGKWGFTTSSFEIVSEDKENDFGDYAYSKAEELVLKAVQTVNSKYNLDNIVIETSPEGNLHITTLDGADICTLDRSKFTDEDIDDLRFRGLYKELNESKEVDLQESKEEYSFQEIITRMENATDYSELYDAASLIVDEGLRTDVELLLDDCENSGDDVETAYSIVCSDLLDSMIGKENKLEEKLDGETSYKQKFMDYCEGRVADLGEVEIEGIATPYDVLLTYDSIETFDGHKENVSVIEADPISGVLGLVEGNRIILESGEDMGVDLCAFSLTFSKIAKSVYDDIVNNWEDFYDTNMKIALEKPDWVWKD